MQVRKLCFIAGLILSATAAGCSKLESEDSPEKGLTGTWEWVRTDGGIGYHIHETPASTGKNIQLLLTAARKYSIYTNGTLSSGGTYTLEKRQCIHDGAQKDYIHFSSPSDGGMMVEKLDSASLELSDEFNDGLNSIYKRTPRTHCVEDKVASVASPQ